MSQHLAQESDDEDGGVSLHTPPSSSSASTLLPTNSGGARVLFNHSSAISHLANHLPGHNTPLRQAFTRPRISTIIPCYPSREPITLSAYYDTWQLPNKDPLSFEDHSRILDEQSKVPREPISQRAFLFLYLQQHIDTFIYDISAMAVHDQGKQYVPLTCHGHSRPVPHLSFSNQIGESDEEYYMISACKDNNPMLRDGLTGDWIGTFFGHKGAVYQARLSPDATFAATSSADFTAKVWDTHTGEALCTLEHNHIVRAIAFPPEHGNLLATGGMEKKLRVFDLGQLSSNSNRVAQNGQDNAGVDGITLKADKGFEVGVGVHRGAIKAIIWTRNPNFIVTAADDKVVRWFDLRTRALVQELQVEGDIGSCEYSNQAPNSSDIGGGYPVLTIAAGKSVYFYGGLEANTLLKKMTFPYEVASAALHTGQRKVVTGGIKDTWAKVYDYDTEAELDVHKGHHGPIWSISFSPDGRLYATGSEDGTIKMWKNCQGPFGLWRADREG